MSKTELVIETGIPRKPSYSGSSITAQISKMKVMQSFRLPAGMSPANIYTLAARGGVKLSTRKVQEGSFVGYRAWRVK